GRPGRLRSARRRARPLRRSGRRTRALRRRRSTPDWQARRRRRNRVSKTWWILSASGFEYEVRARSARRAAARRGAQRMDACRYPLLRAGSAQHFGTFLYVGPADCACRRRAALHPQPEIFAGRDTAEHLVARFDDVLPPVAAVLRIVREQIGERLARYVRRER